MSALKICALFGVVICFSCSGAFFVLAQTTTDWANISGRAVVGGPIPAGFDPKNVQVDPASAAALGLNSNAKEYLQSKYDRSTMKDGCVKDPKRAMGGLDTKFAECATKFFQAWEKTNGPVRITSAYRSQQDQECVCPCARTRSCDGITCANSGSSHSRGTAIDVWPRDTTDAGIQRFHQAARAFGGLHFRLGMRDRPHLEPNGAACASGDGGAGIQAQQPQSPFTQGLQQALGGTQPQGSFQPYPTAATNPNQSALNSINQQNRQAEAQAAATPTGGSGSGGGSGGGTGGGGAGSPTGGTPYGTQVNPDGTVSSLFSQGTNSALLPLSSAKLICSPEDVVGGSTSTLSWECPSGSTPRILTNRSTRIRLADSTVGAGSVVVTPPMSTEYTLSCVRNTQLVAQGVCSVAVRAAPKEPELRVSLSEEEVLKNDVVTITWSAKNVKSGSCTLTGTDGLEVEGNSGTVESDPLVAKVTTYTLECTALDGGREIEKAQVRVVKQLSRPVDDAPTVAPSRTLDDYLTY